MASFRRVRGRKLLLASIGVATATYLGCEQEQVSGNLMAPCTPYPQCEGGNGGQAGAAGAGGEGGAAGSGGQTSTGGMGGMGGTGGMGGAGGDKPDGGM